MPNLQSEPPGTVEADAGIAKDAGIAEPVSQTIASSGRKQRHREENIDMRDSFSSGQSKLRFN
jgi:hypothetical protein